MYVSNSQPLLNTAIVHAHLIIVILALTFSFLSTTSYLRVTPKSCSDPVCVDNPLICPDAMVCESEVPGYVTEIVNVCVLFFMCEYLIRLLTCWAVDSREAFIVPDSWYRDHRKGEDPPRYPTWEHVARYLMRDSNVVGLLCFSLYPIVIAKDVGPKPKLVMTAILQSLWSIKVVNVLRRYPQIRRINIVLYTVFRRSRKVLAVVFLFTIVTFICFGTIVYYLERGRFTATEEYPAPLGVYLRRSADGYYHEPSPYRSIPVGVYWAITTGMSEGYGDITPTSPGGRFMACLLQYMSMIMVALPIGIISANLSLYQDKFITDLEHCEIAQEFKHEIREIDIQIKVEREIGIDWGLHKLRHINRDLIHRKMGVEAMTVEEVNAVIDDHPVFDMYGVFADIFMIVDGSSTRFETISKCITAFIFVTICVGSLSQLLGTLPALRVIPGSCSDPVCLNVTDVCAGGMVCESMENENVFIIQRLCGAIYSLEYVVRLGTCWTVTSREANILPFGWYVQHTYLDSPPVYSLPEHLVRFMLSVRNIIDLAAIVPSYLAYDDDTYRFAYIFVSSSLMVRILRLFGVLSRYTEVKKMTMLFIATLRRSLGALMVLAVNMAIACSFFGSLIYACEIGTFTATEEFPDGVYLRRSIDGYHHEPSPFRSVFIGMYLVVQTISTVGYGDLAPTSAVGRLINTVMMYFSTSILAIPVGLITSSFIELYSEYYHSQDESLKYDKETNARLRSHTLLHHASKASVHSLGSTPPMSRAASKALNDSSSVMAIEMATGQRTLLVKRPKSFLSERARASLESDDSMGAGRHIEVNVDADIEGDPGVRRHDSLLSTRAEHFISRDKSLDVSRDVTLDYYEQQAEDDRLSAAASAGTSARPTPRPGLPLSRTQSPFAAAAATTSIGATDPHRSSPGIALPPSPPGPVAARGTRSRADSIESLSLQRAWSNLRMRDVMNSLNSGDDGDEEVMAAMLAEDGGEDHTSEISTPRNVFQSSDIFNPLNRGMLNVMLDIGVPDEGQPRSDRSGGARSSLRKEEEGDENDIGRAARAGRTQSAFLQSPPISPRLSPQRRNRPHTAPSPPADSADSADAEQDDAMNEV